MIKMECAIMLRTLINKNSAVRALSAYMLTGYSKKKKLKVLIFGYLVLFIFFAVYFMLFFPIFQSGSVFRDYLVFDEGNSRVVSCKESERGSIERLTLISNGKSYNLNYNGKSLDCDFFRSYQNEFFVRSMSGFIIEMKVDGVDKLAKSAGLLRFLMPSAFFYFLVTISFTIHILSRFSGVVQRN